MMFNFRILKCFNLDFILIYGLGLKSQIFSLTKQKIFENFFKHGLVEEIFRDHER